MELDALVAGGEYRSRKLELVRDANGDRVAELAVVPPLLVARCVAAQRGARPLPVVERAPVLARAADVFAGDVLGGLGFDEYVALTSRAAGLPISVARAGARAVLDGLRSAHVSVGAARPAGAAFGARTSDASAVWARRGDVLAVHASGNAPGVHGLWPQSLLLGYRVAVRPSRREPFTAHRLILALRSAGLPAADAVYLPTDHAGADELVRCSDLALVYGGQDVADRYRGDDTVKVNGPGRSKIVVGADWEPWLDVIADSVAHLGGTACVNATAVLVDGDPVLLARALAERLAALPALPPGDEHAVLPVRPVAEARRLAEHLAARAGDAVAVAGADRLVAELGGGLAALRPAVHALPVADDRVDAELPFPCVWVAALPDAPALEAVAPLRGSLVVSVLGRADLVPALLDDPTIGCVYVGRPTHFAAPEVPHDGFLADFLMRTKGFAAG